MQLFFRLNQQQYRNRKYKNNKKPGAPGSDANPIDIDGCDTNITGSPSQPTTSDQPLTT
jgi:hypothetical protein